MNNQHHLALLCAVITTTCLLSACSKSKQEQVDACANNKSVSANQDPTKNTQQQTPTKEESNIAAKNTTKKMIVTNPSDLLVLVNKQRYLPEGYEPKDLITPSIPSTKTILVRYDAAKALEQLFAKANHEGIQLVGVSAYRSAKTQKKVFNSSVAAYGQKHTLHYVAYPGSSEHQTGLAIDVSAKNLGGNLTPSFESTKEAKWLVSNAAQFGFIIRYPKNKEQITGYSYEPWHLRYVGSKVAKEVTESQLTLDEYLSSSSM